MLGNKLGQVRATAYANTSPRGCGVTALQETGTSAGFLREEAAFFVSAGQPSGAGAAASALAGLLWRSEPENVFADVLSRLLDRLHGGTNACARGLVPTLGALHNIITHAFYQRDQFVITFHATPSLQLNDHQHLSTQ